MDIQMGELSQSRCVGRGEEPRGPPHLPSSQHLQVFTSGELSEPYTLGLLWRFIIISLTPFWALLSPQENCEWAENSKLLIVAWSFWWPAPIQEPYNNHLIRTKNTPVTQEILRISGDLCQELRSKAKISTKDAPSVLLTSEIPRVSKTLPGIGGRDQIGVFCYLTIAFRFYYK